MISLELIKTKLLSISKIAVLTPLGKEKYNVLVLEKRKGKIFVSDQFNDLSSDHLVDNIGIGTPVLICFIGKEVLIREVSSGERINLLQSVLPGADPNDFWVSATDMTLGRSLISVVRKSFVKTSIEEIRKLSVDILFVDQGLSAIVDVKAMGLLEKNGQLILKEYKLAFTDIQLTSISTEGNYTEETYDLGGLMINSDFLLEFAMAFKYLIGDKDIEGIPDVAIVDRILESENKLIFKKLSKVSLGVAFIIVLGNFFLFSGLYSRNQEMSEAMQIVEGKLDQLERLENEYILSIKLIDKMGWDRQSRVSYYADRIGVTIPLEGVELTAMTVYPEEEKEKDGIKQYRNKWIKVEGYVTNDLVLDNWISDLSKEEWVSNVELDRYEKDIRETNGIFYIRIESK